MLSTKKMAGYWPSVQVSFLKETKSKSTETPKKRTRSISSETDSTKHGQYSAFFRAPIRSQDSVHLTRSRKKLYNNTVNDATNI